MTKNTHKKIAQPLNGEQLRQRRIRGVIMSLVALVVVGVSVFVAIAITRTPQSSATNENPTTTQSDAPVTAPENAAELIVREDSRTLNDVPDAKVTFVEFLDFECEACAFLYPHIEQLRETYADQVSFVIRYFPIPSHFNAQSSAQAVEAAAQQGKLEEMYGKMYETQSDWGEAQTHKDDLFRRYAEELGLDMEAYDAAYDSPETLAIIERDFNDGVALGVQGTPTFFVNGELLQPKTVQDLTDSIEEALAQ